MLSFVVVPFTNGSPMGMGKMTTFFHPYTCNSPLSIFIFFRMEVGLFENENPALAGLLVRGELWGCAQSLEPGGCTSKNISHNPPRFLEAEI